MANVANCKKCGALFLQTSNRIEVCDKCFEEQNKLLSEINTFVIISQSQRNLYHFAKAHLPFFRAHCLLPVQVIRDRQKPQGLPSRSGRVHIQRRDLHFHAEHAHLFPGIAHRHRIIKNIRGNFYQPHNNNPNVFIPIDKNSAIQLMKSYEKVVVKPTESDTTGSGKNVQILYTQQDEALITQTLQDYKNDYIVQEFIQQHSYLSNLNESSVNTFRIMTLLYKGKIHTLPSSLLVGDTRPTSNGGFFRIGIDQSGNLRNFIIKGKGEAISSLPNVKGDFDVQIPHFSDVIDMAKSMHMCIPHIGLVGWDFSLDKVGNPIFIELNPMYPGSEIIELCNTPLFGDLSDEIFAEVTKKDQILKTVL